MTKPSIWNGKTHDNLWSSAGNWANGLPVAGQNVVFSGIKIWDVQLQAAGSTSHAAAGSLSVHTGQLTLSNGTLDLTPGYAAHGLTYDVLIDKGATLTVAAGASVNGHQTLGISSDNSANQLVVLGTISEEFAVVDAGLVTVSSTGHYVAGASGLVIGGGATLLVTAGGTLDGGPNGLNVDTLRLDLGDGFGNGNALITGVGSSMTLAAIEVGNYFSGTLTIAAGAHVTDERGHAGQFGDGSVVVTGKGSTWTNLQNTVIGGAVPVAATLTVTNGGTVTLGSEALYLYDHLNIDGSAKLLGANIYDGGEIRALAGAGAVVAIGQAISITRNWLYNGNDITNVSADAGTTLRLTGVISGSAQSVLEAGIGQVVLTNTANTYGSTAIYAATLEAAKNGALGAGHIAFLGGTIAATLQADVGVRLTNVIDGFGAADTIDLRGFAFGGAITEAWAQNSVGHGGTLTLSAGNAHTSLLFSSDFSASSFTLSSDGHTGTAITLTH